MKLRWSLVVLGVIVGLAFGLLLAGGVALLVILFGPSETLQDVLDLPRFDVISSMLLALGAAWGAYVASRRVTDSHVLYGLLIGLGIGIIGFALANAPFLGKLLSLLMALPAGVLGSRAAVIGQHRNSDQP